MFKRTSHAVIALLLGVLGFGAVTNTAQAATARPAHASNCGYYLGADHAARGYCYTVQSLGVDRWRAYLVCGQGTIYGEWEYFPGVISTTPTCYSTTHNYGVVYT